MIVTLCFFKGPFLGFWARGHVPVWSPEVLLGDKNFSQGKLQAWSGASPDEHLSVCAGRQTWGLDVQAHWISHHVNNVLQGSIKTIGFNCLALMWPVVSKPFPGNPCLCPRRIFPLIASKLWSYRKTFHSYQFFWCRVRDRDLVSLYYVGIISFQATFARGCLFYHCVVMPTWSRIKWLTQRREQHVEHLHFLGREEIHSSLSLTPPTKATT